MGSTSVGAPAALPGASAATPVSDRLALAGEPPGASDHPPGASPESRPDARPELPPEASAPSAGSNTRPAAEPAADAPPPLYRAQLPPPFLWRYTLRRGALAGSADLHFERSGDDYALDLRGTVIGLEVLGQRSQGTTGMHGLEPARFVERRMGRDRMSANFDRAKAQISYSGPTTLKPLLPGVQDRLSWMVQLGAVIAADPERFVPGSVVLISISGVRADVDTWAFQVQGVEQLNLPSGVVNRALRIFRQPRQPYDTQIEVWLDPQRHHLPVQARMTVLPSRDRLDLVLDP